MEIKYSVLALAVISLMGNVTVAQPMAAGDMGHTVSGHGKHIRITYENLTAGQVFSPSAFVSHNTSAPKLFELGKPASFELMRIAEEGNAGPLLSDAVVQDLGGAYGSATAGVSVPPGMMRTVDLEVDAEHPMISGAFMLVMTNDGFTGVSGVDTYDLTRPVTIDLYAYDAGTERNNERAPYLVAMQGTERDPEHGVVTRHTGIRGDADAPGTWKFDPRRPVARITFSPLGAR